MLITGAQLLDFVVLIAVMHYIATGIVYLGNNRVSKGSITCRQKRKQLTARAHRKAAERCGLNVNSSQG